MTAADYIRLADIDRVLTAVRAQYEDAIAQGDLDRARRAQGRIDAWLEQRTRITRPAMELAA